MTPQAPVERKLVHPALMEGEHESEEIAHTTDIQVFLQQDPKLVAPPDENEVEEKVEPIRVRMPLRLAPVGHLPGRPP